MTPPADSAPGTRPRIRRKQSPNPIGVYYDNEKRKWTAHVKIRGRRVYRKYHTSASDAARDYREVRRIVGHKPRSIA